MDAAWEQRLETLAARVEHLEAELEGLQDAVYHQAVREQENIGELRRRTEPEQLARDLERDARRRGL
jgi:cell division protein FtsB